jgi:DNA-binding transcriptional regulator YdaS (Cro superfamily)
MKNKEIIQEIFKHYGSQANLARSLGISRQSVSDWTNIPAHHCLKIQEQTHSKFSIHMMRPDIFGIKKS